MNKTFSAVVFIFIYTILTSCAQNNNKDYVVTIKTSYGDMVAILYDETPKHKANFIKLAKELELRVVAEGVETEEQLETLRSMGCDEIQGYLVSRPVPADGGRSTATRIRSSTDDSRSVRA